MSAETGGISEAYDAETYDGVARMLAIGVSLIDALDDLTDDERFGAEMHATRTGLPWPPEPDVPEESEDDEPLTWWDVHEDEVMEERAIRGER